jgi:hypothetical protein
MRIGHTGTYSDGRYTHEWVKLDRVGNLPLYLRQSKDTANSFENIARFGEHSYSTHRFEVFGSIAASGATITGDILLGDFNKISGVATDNLVIGVDKNNASGGSSIDFQLDGSTSALFINNSRNVGIGTTSPNVRLELRREDSGDLFELNRPASTVSALYGGVASNHPYLYSNNGIFTLGVNNPDGGTGGEVSYITMRNGSTRYTTFEAGNVGIGVTNPSRKLVVGGNVGLSGSNTYIFGGDDEILAGQDASGYYFATGNGQNVNKPVFIGDNNSYIGFGSGNTERVRITSSGEVGIGTDAPTSKLDITPLDTYDGITIRGNIVPRVVFNGSNSGSNHWGVGIHDNNGNQFAIGHNTSGHDGMSDYLVISTSGNVGIGGTPASVTHGPHLDIVGNRGTLTVGTGYFEDNGTTNFLNGARPLAFGYSGTEYMRVHSNGNVGIGDTAPYYKLDVNGTLRSTGAAYFNSTVQINSSLNMTDGDITNGYNIYGNYFRQRAHGIPRNNLGDPTVTEMALFDSQFTCKTDLSNSYNDLSDLEFYVQSTSSSEWTEVTSYSDDQKRRFLRTNNSSVIIPNLSYKYRVEFNAQGYTFANALYMYWSSQSHSTQVHIWKQRASDDTWIQHTSSTVTVSSWPGHLWLPFSTIPWLENSNSTSTSHYHKIRIEFTPNWSGHATYGDRDIILSGGQIWGGYPTGRRTPHYYDQNGLLTTWGQFKIGDIPSQSSEATALVVNTSNVVGYRELGSNAFNSTSYLPLAGGTMSGVLTLSQNNAIPLNITGANSSYTAIAVKNTGSGNAGMYYDAINGDLAGSDYGFIGQEDAGYMLYDIGTSSPAPYHVFTGGNVGIGTTSPSEKLDIRGGDLQIYNSYASGVQIKMAHYDPAAGTTYDSSIIKSVLDAISPQDAGSSMLRFYTNKNSTTNSAVALDLTKDKNAIFYGNVGIGTTSPSEKLHVNGNIGLGTNPFIKWTSNTLTFLPFGDYIPVVKLGGTTSYAPRLDIYNAGDTSQAISFNGGGSSYINSGNVGIGTTSPANKLHIAAPAPRIRLEDTLDTSNYSVIAADNGQLTFSADEGNNQGSSAHIFKIDNTEKVRFTSGGNVGIGTTSPSERLHVFSSSDPTIKIGGGVSEGTTGGTSTLQWSANNGTYGNAFTATYYKDASNDRLTFIDGGTNNVLTLKNGGNVGIGTTSPSSKLHVAGQIMISPSSGTPSLKFQDSGTTNAYIDLTDGQQRFDFRDDSDTVMSVTLNTLRVGIGTTSPARTLDVVGDASISTTGTSTGLRITTSTSGEGYLIFGDPDDASMGGIAYDNSTNALMFDANNAECIRIDSSGNVGIGTTTPQTKLHVQGVIGTINGTASAPPHSFYSDLDSGMFRAAVNTLGFSTGGTEKLRIDSSGNVGIGDTTPSYKLDVNGTLRTTGQAYFNSNVTITGSATMAGGTMTGNLEINTDRAVYNASYFGTSTASTRSKIRFYGTDATYAIGMQNNCTYGGLGNTWAMTFQFSNANNRGFWWGDSSHSQAQGAMALTTDGNLTVASRIRVGYGESDTTTPATYALDATGEVAVTSGDVELTTASRGIILKSPNGTRYLVNINDSGELTTSAV